jgi:hypothetical protein
MGPSSARQLKESDTEQFKKHIHDRHPTLKSDLAGLSDTLVSFVECGCPPDRRLVLETLKDDEIPTKTLGELSLTATNLYDPSTTSDQPWSFLQLHSAPNCESKSHVEGLE